MVLLDTIRSVRDQSAAADKIARRIDRRETVSGRESTISRDD